jgi:hypothetical protein
MSSRRPGFDASDTNTSVTTPAAPNYSGDDDETLIRVTPLPVLDEEDDLDELTMRRSTVTH